MARNKQTFIITKGPKAIKAGGLWEVVIDFTKIKKDGIRLDDLLFRLCFGHRKAQ
jgi:hypothetical protein